MEKLEKDDITALDTLLKKMDRNVSIGKIDYERESVHLNYLRNRGTPDEFVDEDFCEVNVAMNSIPATIYDVVNTVFKKCVV